MPIDFSIHSHRVSVNPRLCALGIGFLLGLTAQSEAGPDRQLTFAPQNHNLDNNDNFSPDDHWLAFDPREDDTAIAGNAVIARVELATGKTTELYRESLARPWGPGVGAANVNPVDGRVAFIRGLTSATAERPYAMWRRTGAVVHPDKPGVLAFLDARDVVAPFTPGALRGGTHRHEWSGDGRWIGFTYNDALLADIEASTGQKVNLRTIGVATRIARGPVRVSRGPENHDGEMFAAVVARVVPKPRPGSDEISRAFEDAWVGRVGYRRADGGWQHHARAFLGTVRATDGRELTEVFIVDIPERIDVPGDSGPLEGTATTMPQPPRGTTQRRLTFTAAKKFPGVALEPRHWVRSSPDGTRIVFLSKDDAGVVQAFLVSPLGGEIVQATHGTAPVQSCVRWSPDGASLLYVTDGSVTVCDARLGSATFGQARALTAPTAQLPENIVWSHDGKTIAFNRRVLTESRWRQQIFLVSP
jgi:hypothetical protein